MYTAVSKLLDYETFKIQLSKSPFISKYATELALALPIIEIIVVLSFAFKRTRLFGLYSSLFLMTMFTAYIYLMLHFSFYVPCSCGGVLSKMDWNTHLWFNIGFVVLAIAGVVLDSKELNRQVERNEQLPSVAYTAIS
jgi:hypothetical protein